MTLMKVWMPETLPLNISPLYLHSVFSFSTPHSSYFFLSAPNPPLSGQISDKT